MQQEGNDSMSNTGSWSLLAGLARQGVDNFVAIQKTLLDISAQENARLLRTAQQNLGGAVTPDMAELAAGSTQAFLQSQKMMLDVAVQQNQMALGLIRAGGPALGKLADMLAETAQTFVEAQKRLLDFTGQQAEAMLKAAREGETVPNPLSQMADIWRYSLDAIVDAHKKLLDLIAQGTASLTARWQAQPGQPSAEPVQDFVDRARQDLENYINLQRRLTEQAAREMADSIRAVPLQDLARQGVEAFVNTQRAILDLTVRAMSGVNRS
jgi:hypothetical protein